MNSVTCLSVGRIGLGVASLVRPDLVASTMAASSSSPVMTQWFGTREIALGTATLLVSGSARRTLVLVGMAVDGADAVTAYAAVDQGTLPRERGLAFAGVAAGAVLAGLLGLRVTRTSRITAV